MKQIGLTALALLLAAGIATGETPRFRGPAGDGHFTATGLLSSWPEGGPPVAWTVEGIGEGYSSVSVSGERLFVTGMDEDQQGLLFILDPEGNKTGRIVYGPETPDAQAPGPRSTPTVEDDRAYLISGLGVAYALDLGRQAVLWQADLFKRFGAENITWSLAESPLLDGDKIICTPGGTEGVVVALNKMTGETVWAMKEFQDRASYCSPVIIAHNGRRLLLTMTAANILCLDPATGALLWNHPHRTEYDINAVSPVYGDGILYCSSGYKSGGVALKLSDDGGAVTELWTDNTLDCQHHGVVLIDGYIYGGAHRNSFVCLELATGKVMWNEKKISQADTVCADGMLYVYEGPRKGIVSLVKPNPQGLDIQGQFTVTAGTNKHWAHPTVARGLLFIRRGDAVIAYDIRAK